MPTLEHEGYFYEVDPDGSLVHFEKWNPNWALLVAEVEGLPELNTDHYKAIKTLRINYAEKGAELLSREFSKSIGLPLWKIHELFTSRPRKVALRMAGIPKTC